MLEPYRFVYCLERILVSKAGGVYDVSISNISCGSEFLVGQKSAAIN